VKTLSRRTALHHNKLGLALFDYEKQAAIVSWLVKD
jgi:hypothetical protein